jgi:methionyl-tRNA formyltransferase
MNKLKVFFLGTPEFSIPSLEILTAHPAVELLGVISQPDKPAGRGQELKSPEVITFAKTKKIPFFQTDNINKDEALLTHLENSKPDIFIVLAFAQFLGSKVLNIPSKGCFNIHTSLLPKYRGAAPIQYALLNGDPSTGVSIQKMVKKMDAGDLVHGVPYLINPNENLELLYTRLKFAAGLALSDFLFNLSENKISYSPQNENQVSFAPTIKKDDGFINFKTLNFDEILNRLRGYYVWPGIFCFIGDKRLKVFAIEKYHHNLKPGEFKNIDGKFIIGCLDGSVRLSLIQIEGKSKTNDIDFLKGYRETIEVNKNI